MWPPERITLTPSYPLITKTLLAACCLLIAASQPGHVYGQSYIGSYGCDSSKLFKCQQDIMRDLHSVGLSAGSSDSVQYPLSGPPYSPSQQQSQLLANSVCRPIRANLNCLLLTTPACYERDIPAAKNTDVILRSKRFLEEHNCNLPDISWRTSDCFRSQEVRLCEDRYLPQVGSFAWSRINTTCREYEHFKLCINRHLTLQCRVHEADMENEYLIDKANDLAWRCPLNSTNSNQVGSYFDSYSLNNSPGSILSPNNNKLSFNNYAALDQRPIPPYVGASGLPSWQIFRDQGIEGNRLTVGGYAPSYGIPSSGPISERLQEEATDCIVRVQPFSQQCENMLLERQRLAKDTRDGSDFMHRTCCSLFQYKDCLARVVLDRCNEVGTTAVDLLMGSRRRELEVGCRFRGPEACSGSLLTAALNLPLLFIMIKLSTLFMYSQ